MPEIIISQVASSTGERWTMERGLAWHCLSLLAADPNRHATIRMDWSQPPDYLPAMLDFMTRASLRVVFNIDGRSPLDAWRPVKDAGFKIRLCGPVDLKIEEAPGMDLVDELCLYVERPETRPGPAGYNVLCNIKCILIGLGWRDQDSGPLLPAPAEGRTWEDCMLPLVQGLSHRKLDLRFLCGLPLCMFSRKTLGSLAALRMRWPIAICPLEPIITPDGQVHACARLRGQAGSEMHATDFSELSTLRQAASERYRKLQTWCAHDDAMSCRSQRTRACEGGCLADSVGVWQGGGQ